MRFLIATLFVVLAACSSSPKKSATGEPELTPAASASKEDLVKEEAAKAKALKNSAPAKGAIVCRAGAVHRELLLTKENGRCGVSYTKDGNTSQIAEGLEDSKVCVEVLERVRNNLSAAGYDCK